MALTSLSLGTDFPRSTRLETYESVRDETGLRIKIESPCTRQAASLSAKLKEAYEKGALPAATEVLARHVKEANKQGMALQCTLVIG